MLWVVAFLPLRPTMSATLVSICGETSPAAAATPGSARTLSTSAAGMVAWVPVAEPLMSSFSKIAASADAVDASARSRPDCCVESVRMNVSQPEPHAPRESPCAPGYRDAPARHRASWKMTPSAVR
jgi:hypothetical protein